MQLWGQNRSQNRLWKTVGSKIFAAVTRNERRGEREEDGGWGEHVQQRLKERFNMETKVNGNSSRGDQKVKPRRLKQLLGLAQTIIPQRPSVAPFLLIRKQLRPTETPNWRLTSVSKTFYFKYSHFAQLCPTASGGTAPIRPRLRTLGELVDRRLLSRP